MQNSKDSQCWSLPQCCRFSSWQIDRLYHWSSFRESQHYKTQFSSSAAPWKFQRRLLLRNSQNNASLYAGRFWFRLLFKRNTVAILPALLINICKWNWSGYPNKVIIHGPCSPWSSSTDFQHLRSCQWLWSGMKVVLQWNKETHLDVAGCRLTSATGVGSPLAGTEQNLPCLNPEKENMKSKVLQLILADICRGKTQPSEVVSSHPT